MARLILASNSPRRQQLLRDLGFEFEVFTRDPDESFDANMPAGEVAEFLAIKKNRYYRKLLDQEVILTADTTVVLDNLVLNKPGDVAHAAEMLQLLSGKTHQVICGVCISSSHQETSFSETTNVTFDQLSEEEIDHYVQNFQPFDKAGAYGIQEWIGMAKISRIEGSYYNVMGLPTHQVYQVLKSIPQFQSGTI